MPFAGYKDFNDCVRRNRSKRDPKAYCATIMRETEGKMDNLKFQKFIPITKIDEDKKMVYGYASTPDLDADGEIIKVEALKKALPSYLKFPTIREMHQPKSIGVTKQSAVSEKGLYIGAKIVNNDAWELVKEGAYRAFSVGGNVIKKIGNIIHELELVEISLVDVPANKEAVIEVWKRQDGKTRKDADGIHMVGNLLAHLQDIIMLREMKGKDTKKLKRMLEDLKTIIGKEAEEAEPDHKEPMMAQLFEGTQKELDQKIEKLQKMDFGNNKVANLIREGVIESMKLKAKKLKKVEDPEEETEEETTESEEEESTETTGTEGKADTSDEETEDTEEETEETEESEETETEETKETGEITSALSKIDSVNKTLEKISPSKKDSKIRDVSKAVSLLAGSLAKVAETLVSLEGRIATLEKTPAATKSKSAVVMKGIGENNPDADTGKESAELTAKKARLAELEKTYNEVGRVEFAKRGLSAEAMRLTGEIEVLERKSQAS